jgi:hypothetical protein
VQSTNISRKLASPATPSPTWARSPSTTSCGQSFWLPSSPMTTAPFAPQLRPDPRHIQTICARQFWLRQERRPDTPHCAETTRHAHHRPSPKSTTSINDKEATNTSPSSAVSLRNMVNSSTTFSAEPASLTPIGMSLLQSPPSS